MADTLLAAMPVNRPGRARAHLSVSGWISGIVLALVILAAVLAPLIAPYDPVKPVDAGPLTPPSATHLLGTDGFSRDTLSRLIYGAQVSMTVGVATMLIVFALGMILGLTAAYSGRWVDAVIGRTSDAMLAIPGILLAIALLAILGSGVWSIVVALSVVFLPEAIRVVRGTALSVRERLHVRSAAAIGASPPRIIARHIAPFVTGPATVQATFVFAYAILSEAALSFLGVGVQPPAASWGNMIADGLKYLSTAPLQIIIPCVAVTLVVLMANLFSDALRDLIDSNGASR
jgi:peptide/nickel transport system permease protein